MLTGQVKWERFSDAGLTQIETPCHLKARRSERPTSHPGPPNDVALYIFEMTIDLSVRSKGLQREQGPSTTTLGVNRIMIKNRRKRYLDMHPEYFGPQLELAGVELLK